jgi:uncharacterized protein
MHLAHQLTEEFPDAVQILHVLKEQDSHFAHLAETYDKVNETVQRMEANIEPADDFTMEKLKKKRLALIDEIAALLRSQKN